MTTTHITDTDYYHYIVDRVHSDSFGPCDLDTAVAYAKAALSLLNALNMDWLVCNIISDTTGEICAEITNEDDYDSPLNMTIKRSHAQDYVDPHFPIEPDEKDDYPNCNDHCYECPDRDTCPESPLHLDEEDDDENVLYLLIAQMRRILGQ